MDAHTDTDAAARAGEGPPPPPATAPTPGKADGEAWEGLLCGIEERVAGLVEKGLGRLGGEIQKARRLEAEAAFTARHPDFADLKKSGRLDALRRDNPLLDEVGAYFADRLEHERQDMADRLEKAAKDAEKRVLEGLRVRRQAATLSQGLGAAPSGAADPEMADPARFGGINAVLARRLATRRATAGN